MTPTPSNGPGSLSPLIVTAGSGWVVVDKPCGAVMHGEPGEDLVAMVQKTLSADVHLKNQVQEDLLFGLHPVHRLDRDTSGLVLLACRRDVFRWFSKQFEQGQVDKLYLAMVHGQVTPDSDFTLWDHALSHRPGGRDTPAGAEPRVAARTKVQVLAKSPHYTMLRCRLETGRKHQIRRHAALAGHPVVGDRRYASIRAIKYLEKIGFKRLALHSASLGIVLPGQKNTTILSSAHLPDVIVNLFSDDGGSADWMKAFSFQAVQSKQ